MGSRREGLYTSVGIMLGIGVHLTYCLLGLLLIVKNSELLYLILKYACAGYLFYLGQQAIRHKASAIPSETIGKQSEAGILTPWVAG